MELHNIGFDSMYFLYIVLYTGSFYANTIWIYMQMTQDEIIKLAREADLVTWLNTSKKFNSGCWWIEAHEPDDCLFKFAELVAQREREACAEIADRMPRIFRETKDAHERLSPEPFIPSNFGFDFAVLHQAERIAHSILARGQA